MHMRLQLVLFWLSLAACSVSRVSFTPEDAPPTDGDGPALCTDTRKNGTETDVDCGGSCAACDVGRSCAVAMDCVTDVCQDNRCVAASCADRVLNGSETDTDCGGGCGPCATGRACGAGEDCASRVCTGVCQEATCDDAVGNGTETDADCGGSCGACADGKACGESDDCSSRVCASGRCETPTCMDRVANGAETDVDCGGVACSACAFGQSCAADVDCASAGVCDGLHCRPAQSCAEIHQRRPGAADGAYSIAPMGGAPFDAVCDMTRDGGGWTLLLKSMGGPALAYADAAWTDTSVLNATDLTTASGDAKYPSFLSVPITTLRGELDGFRFTKEIAGTALQIFSGPAAFVDGFQLFNADDPKWSAQPNCHVFGINLPFSTRARFGWSANQENDCVTNDTGIGLGVNGHGAGFQCGSTLCSHGNIDAGGNGLLWGR